MTNPTRRALFPMLATTTALLAFSGFALAEPTPQILKDQIIKSRAPRPSAVAEVARITPNLSADALRPLVLDRVEQSVAKDPF